MSLTPEQVRKTHPNHPWSVDEVKILKGVYPLVSHTKRGMQNKMLLLRLLAPHSWESIKQMAAKRLGIHCKVPSTPERRRELDKIKRSDPEWKAARKQYEQDWYRKNAPVLRLREVLRGYQLKKKAFEILGGSHCRSCGNSDMRVLQINHINGVSKNSRESYRRASKGLWWLIVNGQREGLEVLCANCNIIYEFERGKRRLYEGIPMPTVRV